VQQILSCVCPPSGCACTSSDFPFYVAALARDLPCFGNGLACKGRIQRAAQIRAGHRHIAARTRTVELAAIYAPCVLGEDIKFRRSGRIEGTRDRLRFIVHVRKAEAVLPRQCAHLGWRILRIGVNIVTRHGDESNTDRKSTRLNSSHVSSSYAVFCLKKNKDHREEPTIPKLT